MPIEHYFKGKGEKVMGGMKRQYGAKKGERVFYATAQKKGMGRKMGRGRKMRFGK